MTRFFIKYPGLPQITLILPLKLDRIFYFEDYRVRSDEASEQELSTFQIFASSTTVKWIMLLNPNIKNARQESPKLKVQKHWLVRLRFLCYNVDTNREHPRESAPLAEPLKTAGIN